MTRNALFSGVCAALLLASAAPADAGCLSDACSRGSVAPQAVIVPPIVLLQIETASKPIQLLAVAPNDADTGEATTLGPVPPGGIGSVGDLDGGVAAWNTIDPGVGAGKLAPEVPPLHPARHMHAVPASTEVALADHLSLEVPAELRPTGVPGIDRDSAGEGNRALWYSNR